MSRQVQANAVPVLDWNALMGVDRMEGLFKILVGKLDEQAKRISHLEEALETSVSAERMRETEGRLVDRVRALERRIEEIEASTCISEEEAGANGQGEERRGMRWRFGSRVESLPSAHSRPLARTLPLDQGNLVAKTLDRPSCGTRNCFKEPQRRSKPPRREQSLKRFARFSSAR